MIWKILVFLFSSVPSSVAFKINWSEFKRVASVGLVGAAFSFLTVLYTNLGTIVDMKTWEGVLLSFLLSSFISLMHRIFDGKPNG